jgi:streptomycin 6-kinase
MMIKLQSDFTTRIIEMHGGVGYVWLKGLPSLIASIEKQWCIQAHKSFPNLTYNYVAPAIQDDGSEVILKLGIPGLHIEHEAECLRRYDGKGAPFILEYDPELGAMLVERVRPGANIKEITEAEAIEAAVSVMQQLHQAPISGNNLPTVQDWWLGFQRLRKSYSSCTSPFPERLVDEAESIYAELAESMGGSVLLHGDLHHGNILAGGRLPWLAIDPQGLIGEPAYEVGAFLRNPYPDLLNWKYLEKILEERIATFSDLLSIDEQRIAKWGYSQAVLSAIWTLEDHGSGWEGAIEVAHALRTISSA